MEFEKVLEKRYSVRKYKSKPVEEEKILKILNAGRLAPTSKNTQPQQIYVIKTPDGLKKLKEITPCSFDAPLAFLMCGNKERECVTSINKKSLMEIDVAIVQTQMMLMATDLGLGTCWVCMIDYDKAREVFDLGENIIPYSLLIVGYADEESQPNIRHTQRYEFDSYVKEV